MKFVACITVITLLATTSVTAATCNAISSTQRVALLELYTSEGCDSCPPADRWASALSVRGFGVDRVITLAYHVDYWNHLGWKDPFAQARFTERQRFVNNRIRNRTIYTPQLMLDGKDYRAGLSLSDFQQRISAVNREKPGADIALSINTTSGTLETAAQITLHRKDTGAAVFLALIENKLANQVSAGENKGKRLEHDFVVRELAGPFSADAKTINHKFRVAPAWKTRDLSVAAFVQTAAAGEVLQALVLPYCTG
ncbi:MAG: DUF1223 domain-containing protein [Burkholderiales bacterium]